MIGWSGPAVMKLITPPIALPPYNAEYGPRTTSTRSTLSNGMPATLTPPDSALLTGCPSIITSVRGVRGIPRSDSTAWPRAREVRAHCRAPDVHPRHVGERVAEDARCCARAVRPRAGSRHWRARRAGWWASGSRSRPRTAAARFPGIPLPPKGLSRPRPRAQAAWQVSAPARPASPRLRRSCWPARRGPEATRGNQRQRRDGRRRASSQTAGAPARGARRLPARGPNLLVHRISRCASCALVELRVS